MSQRLHLLGIRHHGPGSAASVLAALEDIRPQIILIEGPFNANDIIAYAAHQDLKPPVAILVHEEDAPEKSVFYPFASFSPEWQALQWALKHGRRARFIDLPPSMRGEGEEEHVRHRDPLTDLANLAGESDGESWWNRLVEQSAHGTALFAAIETAMTAMREYQAPDIINERREAFMRLQIADALQETDANVAVICGAWHVPALRQAIATSKDRAALKGLPKAKTLATWVPWTDDRLAAASGYGAGVISPGWYRHLWHEYASASGLQVETSTARWQTKVAGLLRDEGLPASTASVIEASRLALSIAALRDHAVPGLAEMQDASLAVLCHGDELLLRLIARKLVIGNEIGEVGDDIPQMPLAQDLARWQRKLRLKPSPIAEEAALDLRSDTGFLKSTLFHRLLLINVPWGHLRDAQSGRGTFREIWTLAWSPELSVRLAEALRFGTTIEQAAANAALDAADKSPGLAACAKLVGDCLNADLGEAAEKLTVRLQALSAVEGDILTLMRAAVPLANIVRYGTARKIPKEALTSLVSGMAAEVCAGLGPACRGLNEEAARELFVAMQAFDAAVALLEDEEHRLAWLRALSSLGLDTLASPFLRGFAARKLYDTQTNDLEATSRALSLALSPAVPAQEAGAWAEGFLSGAAQILLHDERLFGLIDLWLSELSEEALMELLPMLRRAVGSFDAMERRRIIEQVKRGPVAALERETITAGDPATQARFEKALPLLKTILGLS